MAAGAMATGARLFRRDDRGRRDDEHLRLRYSSGFADPTWLRAGARSRNRARDHRSLQIRKVQMIIATFCLRRIVILTLPGVRAQRAGAPNQSWGVLRQLQGGEKLELC
jgi:hypothetical protein